MQHCGLNRFGIVEVGNVEKLITNNKEKTRDEHTEDSSNIVVEIKDMRYVVPTEEMFDVLTNVHRSIGHGESEIE